MSAAAGPRSPAQGTGFISPADSKRPRDGGERDGRCGHRHSGGRGRGGGGSDGEGVRSRLTCRRGNLRACSHQTSSGVKATWRSPPCGPLGSWVTLGKSSSPSELSLSSSVKWGRGQSSPCFTGCGEGVGGTTLSHGSSSTSPVRAREVAEPRAGMEARPLPPQMRSKGEPGRPPGR